MISRVLSETTTAHLNGLYSTRRGFLSSILRGNKRTRLDSRYYFYKEKRRLATISRPTNKYIDQHYSMHGSQHCIKRRNCKSQLDLVTLIKFELIKIKLTLAMD